jgi:drug/metabolite transporter (DMT)-like permease
MNSGLARVCALAAAMLFSTGGAAIKVAAFSAAQVSMLRSGIAAVALYIWYRRQLRPSTGAQSDPRPVAGRWPPSIAAGIVYAATLTLFVAATKLTTAANAIFLQSTAPLYIVVLGPWLLRERATRGDLAFLAAMSGGMALCFLGEANPTSTAPDPATGNLIAIASGVAWGLTLMALRHLNRTAGPGRGAAGIRAVIAGNVIACVIALPWALPLPTAGPAAWATIVYLGVVQIALAYVCLTSAMRRLPVLEVSLLLLIEPVLNPFWTWIVRGEHPGWWTIAGGAVILGATGIRTLVDRR